ncbi:histone H4 transcription factor-like [Prorops nasuta]|uniref:histone H4 transcription factor-like n=1 Tax=Prorops nasuta TaxID=863751 RepID=UPI0034CF8CF8
MSETEDIFIKSTEVQERCCDWVESQKSNEYEDNISSKKMLQNDTYDYFDIDKEFDSVSECGVKRRRLGKKLKDELLILTCEWEECLYENTHMQHFVKHVSQHIPNIKILMKDNGDEVYACQWKGCFFESTNTNEILKHINYHAYHTKLKCIGSNIRERTKLPKCQRNSEWKNIIDVPFSHMCRWDNCSSDFNNYQYYLYHVIAHVEISPRGNKIEGGINCKWIGCKGKYSNLYKLKDHMRCHTREKVVACPDCGATFASNTKFHMHCQRQIPLEVQGFQCSYCNKFYPTEEILRDHMRLHLFNYKCTYCDMTCESRASLAKHIRYRHISSRTHPCSLCKHAAKSQQDLDSHMTVHTKGPNFSCHFEGCLYMCKGAYTLDRHIERLHSAEVRWYCCHECPVKYMKSHRLTKHLIQAHHLQWPSGHKRFQYTLDEDGCYRLQMVRYECLDEANFLTFEDLPAANQNYKFIIDENSSIPNLNIVIDNDKQDKLNFGESEAKITQNEVGKSMPVISSILISIDEVDSKGNIIKSKTVEAQETNELKSSEAASVILNIE